MDMIFTRSDPEGHLRVAAQMTGSTGFPADAETLAVYGQPKPGADAELICIVVFEHITANSADVHFTAMNPRGAWASRKLMRGLFLYAFRVRGFDFLRARVPEWNIPSLVICVKSGFRFDGKVREGSADGSDAVLFSMREDECTWLEDREDRDDG